MFEKRFLTLNLAPAYAVTAQGITHPHVSRGLRRQRTTPPTEPHLQYRRSRQRQQRQQHQRQHTSEYCRTAGLRSWRRMSHAASPMLQTCKPACCQSAITVSKATSSSISREASEKRNRTASQQHTLIRYRDECSRACSVLCAVFVASVRAILSLPRGNAQNQEAEGLSFS